MLGPLLSPLWSTEWYYKREHTQVGQPVPDSRRCLGNITPGDILRIIPARCEHPHIDRETTIYLLQEQQGRPIYLPGVLLHVPGERNPEDARRPPSARFFRTFIERVKNGTIIPLLNFIFCKTLSSTPLSRFRSFLIEPWWKTGVLIKHGIILNFFEACPRQWKWMFHTIWEASRNPKQRSASFFLFLPLSCSITEHSVDFSLLPCRSFFFFFLSLDNMFEQIVTRAVKVNLEMSFSFRYNHVT